MKRLTITTALVLFTVAFCKINAQTEADMKSWMTYMTPGGVHKMMAKWDGAWKGEVTMWMAPGQPPSKSSSMAANKMILGGRYQESKHSGDFNGMPFEGVSTTGYDNAKKVFISTWIDNMGTGIMTLEGPWDEATKSIMLKGKSIDPMSGKEMDVRETFKIIDDNNQVMEMFAIGPDGNEFKTMEIKFSRKK